MVVVVFLRGKSVLGVVNGVVKAVGVRNATAGVAAAVCPHAHGGDCSGEFSGFALVFAISSEGVGWALGRGVFGKGG